MTIGLQPNNWKAQIALGNLYLASGRFLDARSGAQTVLKGDPQNAEAQILLSSADAGLKDFAKAVPEAQSAIRMNPNLAASYVNLGGIEERNQNNAAAEQNFERAILLDSKSLPAMLALGNLYGREKRWLEAEKQFQAAIAADPKNPTARTGLANVYLLQGRKDAAEHVLRDAKEALTDTQSGYRILGDYYIANRENEKALAEFASLYSQYPTDASVGKTYVQLLILQNRLDEATKINDIILKASPSDTDALILKGQILFGQGKSSDAVHVLEIAVGNAPNNAAAHYYLGMAHARIGDLGAAESEWHQAATLQPRMTEAQRALAKVAIRKNDVELLLECAQQLISAEPRSPEGYVYRATALWNRKDQAGAERDLKKAIEVAPQSPAGYLRMGDLRMAQKRYDDAERFYSQALALSPPAYDAITGLVNVDLARRQPEKALRTVQNQIARVPNNSTLYVLLGQMEVKNQDQSKAESAFEKAIELDKNNVPAFLLLANLQVTRGSFDQAIADYQRALQTNPHDARLYMALGSLLETKNQWQQAEDCYKKALEIQPDYAAAANNLAYLMLEHGDNAHAAFSLAQIARRGLPDSPTTADTLGWAYYNLDLYKNAIALLQEAINQNPRNATYHYHLGMAYEKTNDIDMGKKELQLALKIDPKYVQTDQIKEILAQRPKGAASSKLVPPPKAERN